MFDKFEDDYVQFERIENPPHPCPDVCAFLRLHELVPVKKGIDMLAGAEHDEVYLEVDPEDLEKVATENDVLYLTRCGVRYDEDDNALRMFV